MSGKLRGRERSSAPAPLLEDQITFPLVLLLLLYYAAVQFANCIVQDINHKGL